MVFGGIMDHTPQTIQYTHYFQKIIKELLSLAYFHSDTFLHSVSSYIRYPILGS